jgi:MFS family permease
MAYLHNRTVNLLNLHSLIASLATTGGGAFFTVYLLKAGVSIPGALLSLAAMFLLRLVIRGFLLVIAVRTGLRWLLIAGSLLMGLSYPFLAEVHGIGAGLFLLVLVVAIADTVYWPTYHAYFAALGDEEHRGQQLGVREALNATFGIVSPLIAGWLLVSFGPRVAFVATGVVQALAALPIFWTPDVPVARHVAGGYRAMLPSAGIFIGDGFSTAGYVITWQIALFLALDQNFMAYGGALAVAALVGAAGSLVLGRMIDTGSGGRAVTLSIGLVVIVTFMRASIHAHPALAVAANALGALVSCLYIPTIMTVVYNRAKRSPCAMRFHIAAEAGWDIGISLGLIAAACIVWLGFPVSYSILVSLVGSAMVFVLLRRYYRDHPGIHIEPINEPVVHP